MFLAEFLFEVDGVTRDVFAALGEEEPGEEIEGAAKEKEDNFYWNWPSGSKEDGSVDEAEGDSVAVAAGEDDFFGEWEIAVG